MRSNRNLIDEDPWGSDVEEETSLETSTSTRRTPECPPTSSVAELASRLNTQKTPDSSVQSLQSICLGIVGAHLGELLDFGQDVIKWLPPDVRGSLFSVAKRRSLLNRDNMSLFVDDSWAVFDVAWCAGLSAKVLETTAEKLPRITCLDLSGCQLGPTTLQAFARCCPAVEILRLCNVKLHALEMSESLEASLPSLVQQECVVDSWEDMEASPHPNRWSNLKYIVWPDIPHTIETHVKRLCPKILIVHSGNRMSYRKLPMLANPDVSADKMWIDKVGDIAWEGGDSEGDASLGLFGNIESSSEVLVPIAERFRMAYVELDKRKAAKLERNYKQRKRREERRSGVAAKLAQWLDAE